MSQGFDPQGLCALLRSRLSHVVVRSSVPVVELSSTPRRGGAQESLPASGGTEVEFCSIPQSHDVAVAPLASTPSSLGSPPGSPYWPPRAGTSSRPLEVCELGPLPSRPAPYAPACASGVRSVSPMLPGIPESEASSYRAPGMKSRRDRSGLRCVSHTLAASHRNRRRMACRSLVVAGEGFEPPTSRL